MPKYELTIVIDSLQKTEDMEKVVTKTKSFVQNNGGEIHHVDDWGKKRLAYEINRKQYGNYYQIFFEAPSSLPALLERELKLEDAVLRYMTLTSDYDIADFAKEEQSEETSGTETEPEAQQTDEPPSDEKDSDADSEETEEVAEKSSQE